MRISKFLAALMLALFGAMTAKQLEAKDTAKPNILLIVADDK